jgi:tetratricopeptide (TPR) repeat protein
MKPMTEEEERQEDIVRRAMCIRFSDEHREEGNKLFSQDKFISALAFYNKALVRDDPIRSAKCYGNRSAVYLKLEYFDHCLHNIQLAEKNYPRENIQKLHSRRQRCLELMKTVPDKSMKPYEHTFKLSYDANPKIPFFIDALELKTNNRLITTRDLKAGDIIAILQNPWRLAINDSNADYLKICYNCFDMNDGDLIQGDDCTRE